MQKDHVSVHNNAIYKKKKKKKKMQTKLDRNSVPLIIVDNRTSLKCLIFAAKNNKSLRLFAQSFSTST